MTTLSGPQRVTIKRELLEDCKARFPSPAMRGTYGRLVKFARAAWLVSEYRTHIGNPDLICRREGVYYLFAENTDCPCPACTFTPVDNAADEWRAAWGAISDRVRDRHDQSPAAIRDQAERWIAAGNRLLGTES
jgi:hypothetical protein